MGGLHVPNRVYEKGHFFKPGNQTVVGENLLVPKAKNIVLARVDWITGIGDLRRDSYQAGIKADNTTNDPAVKLEWEPPVPGHVIDPITRFKISHKRVGFKREPG
jgi:hypothetical protein